MFCSEGFTEPWRDYLSNLIGTNFKTECCLNTYGSSELLLMGTETPYSIALKRFLETAIKAKQELFGSEPVPNIFQYNPLFRYIETHKQNLLFTSRSGVPLIRFDIKDRGAVIPFSVASKFVRPPQNTWNLPFVSLWGRSDYTIIFYAANIYPEHIHAALNNKKFLPKITGKFTMVKDYKKNMDEYLEINVELRPSIKVNKKLTKEIQSEVVNKLR